MTAFSFNCNAFPILGCKKLRILFTSVIDKLDSKSAPCKKASDEYLVSRSLEFAHIADALQYACIGLGEGRRMIGLKPIGEIRPARIYQGRKTMRRIMA